jgi:nucleoid-associated protein YgaU
MGRLEKTVVLVVLFLVAVVLGVALNTDDPVAPEGSAGPAGPLAGGPVVLKGAEPSRPTPAAEPVPGGLLELEAEQPSPGETAPPAGGAIEGAGWILPEQPREGTVGGTHAVEAAAPLRPSAPAVAEKPAARPPILTREGLIETPLPELMKYTWRAGDDFASLAQRYYGSRSEAARLQLANEGVRPADLRPGDTIWVPVEDRSTTRAVSADGWQPGELYVVQSGEILGTIAQKVYGSAREWRRIFNANRDVLSDPDTLRAGMRLRIPD